jgi:HSP20 family protein
VAARRASLRQVRGRFALPQEIDEARAEAKFADGVLELTLPKKAAVTGRKLAIN